MCQIRELTESTINTLMQFRASHDVAKYLLDKASENWRNFEAEFSVDYPVKGCGVLANEKLLSDWSFQNNTVLRDDCAIGAHEISEELSTYPISTVSLVYMFSVLEVYGDEVTSIVNPSFVKDRSAWHRKVFLPEEEPSKSDVKKVRNGFAEPFKANPDDIEFSIAAALAHLKNARNLIVHKGSVGFEFDLAMSSVVAIICHINYLVSSDKSAIKIYPWEDYENIFA